MTRFRALIFDATKRLLGAKTFDTWDAAAQKLSTSTHPQRKWSSIQILTNDEPTTENSEPTTANKKVA